tara:strand:+ start:86 stop:202 length:117 start_codon:yes stop_codon:yes gene_type:complete
MGELGDYNKNFFLVIFIYGKIVGSSERVSQFEGEIFPH